MKMHYLISRKGVVYKLSAFKSRTVGDKIVPLRWDEVSDYGCVEIVGNDILNRMNDAVVHLECEYKMSNFLNLLKTYPILQNFKAGIAAKICALGSPDVAKTTLTKEYNCIGMFKITWAWPQRQNKIATNIKTYKFYDDIVGDPPVAFSWMVENHQEPKVQDIGLLLYEEYDLIIGNDFYFAINEGTSTLSFYEFVTGLLALYY